jgi:hypothetical protein
MLLLGVIVICLVLGYVIIRLVNCTPGFIARSILEHELT